MMLYSDPSYSDALRKGNWSPIATGVNPGMTFSNSQNVLSNTGFTSQSLLSTAANANIKNSATNLQNDNQNAINSRQNQNQDPYNLLNAATSRLATQ
ncbi:unnamed protein product, partial [Medioppia subpectinata]